MWIYFVLFCFTLGLFVSKYSKLAQEALFSMAAGNATQSPFYTTIVFNIDNSLCAFSNR